MDCIQQAGLRQEGEGRKVLYEPHMKCVAPMRPATI